jgi:hypothetical protein
MPAVLFVGPTLAGERVELPKGFVRAPPAAQGDVYQAVRRGAGLIGIIDGYFENVPSVWHKEILWAMERGVHIFGAASMGALRAAELRAFGMRGVGRIFQGYMDGVLTDDDEVAVVHGPPEAGYVTLSEAMVNVRATLAAARAAAILPNDTAVLVERAAKGLFYKERTWPAALDATQRRGTPPAHLAAFREWLRDGRVDQKRLDALALVDAMVAFTAADPPPMRVTYRFEWTDMWDQLVAEAEGVRSSPHADRVLEELRLDPELLEAARCRALLRMMAEREERRLGTEPDEQARLASLRRLRERLGLFRRQDLVRWLAASDLDETGLRALVRSEAALEAAVRDVGRMLDAHLLDELRAAGTYPRLAERARRKAEALEACVADESAREAGFRLTVALDWYFTKRLGRPLPDDLEAWAGANGFASRDEFYRAVLREHAYSAMVIAQMP